MLTGADANVVARTGSDGVLLVDGGLAERSESLLQAVAALPGAKPVGTLFNTHWHPEQTVSNLTSPPPPDVNALLKDNKVRDKVFKTVRERLAEHRDKASYNGPDRIFPRELRRRPLADHGNVR